MNPANFRWHRDVSRPVLYLMLILLVCVHWQVTCWLGRVETGELLYIVHFVVYSQLPIMEPTPPPCHNIWLKSATEQAQGRVPLEREPKLYQPSEE